MQMSLKTAWYNKNWCTKCNDLQTRSKNAHDFRYKFYALSFRFFNRCPASACNHTTPKISHDFPSPPNLSHSWFKWAYHKTIHLFHTHTPFLELVNTCLMPSGIHLASWKRTPKPIDVFLISKCSWQQMEKEHYSFNKSEAYVKTYREQNSTNRCHSDST